MFRSLISFVFLVFFISPTYAANSLENLIHNASTLKHSLFGDELLTPEEAFEFSANVKDGNTLYVNWEIAPDYYLYREKIKLELVNANGLKLGDYTIPNGFPKNDEVFGKVEVFHEGLNFTLPVLHSSNNAQTVTLRAKFQGCAERGVCYPPMSKDVTLNLPIAQKLVPLP